MELKAQFGSILKPLGIWHLEHQFDIFFQKNIVLIAKNQDSCVSTNSFHQGMCMDWSGIATSHIQNIFVQSWVVKKPLLLWTKA